MAVNQVYLDMDGVLVDFVGGALRAHGKHAGELAPGEWDVHECLGLSLEAFWSKCSGHHFWSALVPTHDCYHIVDALANFIDLRGIFLLSSPSRDPGCYSGKASWVSRHLPMFERRLILSPVKWPFARTGALLIDDSDANCQSFVHDGGDAILLPRLWNSRHAERAQALAIIRQELKQRKDQA